MPQFHPLLDIKLCLDTAYTPKADLDIRLGLLLGKSPPYSFQLNTSSQGSSTAIALFYSRTLLPLRKTARSSGSPPPASRAVFSPPEESQASSSSSSVSVLGPDVHGWYRSTVPSQTRSRSSSVIREESGLPSTARPISRSSSPALSAGSPSHGDQKMGDVLETLAQPLVLNMLEGASNVSEDLGVILPALDMIRTWIYTHTEHPGTTLTSINLSSIRRNAMRISDHIDSLIRDFNAQGEDSTV
ncbi:hypothetical protein L218DRAFT_996173 [Marasmius fiardii PR-910]|nr:hypothetical protein L218DRAFT_996173 [Marasmius fiardii PR-910]